MKGTVAITGASGYLGGRLATAFAADGWRVIRLVRSPAKDQDRQFLLGQPVERRSLDGIDLLIHAAYDMRAISVDDIWRTNVTGTEQLLQAAAHVGVRRTIVLSSMSAYPGTRQRYGRAKLDIETVALSTGAATVRPGLVVGPNAGGMAGTLAKLTRLPLTPCIAGVGGQFPVLEDDFVAGICALAAAATVPTEAVGLAHPRPVSFPDLLRGIASLVGNPAPRLVPIPWRLVSWTLQAGEALRLPLPLRSDSLLGLLEPAPSVPGVDLWELLGIHLRHLPATERR